MKINLNQFSSAYSSSAAGFAHVSHFTSLFECSLQTKSLQKTHLIVVTLFFILPHMGHGFEVLQEAQQCPLLVVVYIWPRSISCELENF
jgi:hypothetical protein